MAVHSGTAWKRQQTYNKAKTRKEYRIKYEVLIGTYGTGRVTR